MIDDFIEQKIYSLELRLTRQEGLMKLAISTLDQLLGCVDKIDMLIESLDKRISEIEKEKLK